MANFKFVTGFGYISCDKEGDVEVPDEILDECDTEEERFEIIKDYYKKRIWGLITDSPNWKELLKEG